MKNKFFQKFLNKSFELEIAFRKTCQYKWIPLITINELIVQIGHVYSISNKIFSCGNKSYPPFT